MIVTKLTKVILALHELKLELKENDNEMFSKVNSLIIEFLTYKYSYQGGK